MKAILTALAALFTFCTLAVSQSKTVSTTDTDSDSTYSAIYTDIPDDSTYHSNTSGNQIDWTESIANKGLDKAGPIVAIVFFFIFGFPLMVIFIAFYFRYRNRQARYKLMEQALASGQPLPEGLFKENLNTDTRSKGIKNICLGIGLFIFLWAITDSFGLGSIGLLIMFTGIGQWLVARGQHPTDEQK